MKTQIERIVDWNVDAGNTADRINVRQSALYMGLQCEELAEKLLVLGLQGSSEALDNLATKFKTGDYDALMAEKLSDPELRKEMLDADTDLIVVSTGAGMSQGANINGALWETCRSNDSKRDEEGRLAKDANGKIIKGPNFFKPDLGKYIYQE